MNDHQKLSDFLKDMAGDPQQMQAYAANRESTIQNSNLSDKHKQLLLSNDLHGIHNAVLKELAGEEVVMIFAIC